MIKSIINPTPEDYVSLDNGLYVIQKIVTESKDTILIISDGFVLDSGSPAKIFYVYNGVVCALDVDTGSNLVNKVYKSSHKYRLNTLADYLED